MAPAPSPPASTPKSSSPPTTSPSPVPPPVPVETHPNRGAFKPPIHRNISDPTRLAPEDAYKTTFSPPRLRPLTEINSLNGSAAASAAAAALRPAVASLRAPPAIPPVALRIEQERKRQKANRRRRQPHVWKKLLWIKQHGFPDNYTDTETFLDHLQRNPRLRPYDFWPLVADSTVIVQHVCSVAIFICAYAGIYQDRLSPVAVVTCGSIATMVGWVVWDHWMGQEEAAIKAANRTSMEVDDGSSTSSGGSAMPVAMNGHTDGTVGGRGLGLTLSTTNLAAKNNEEKHTCSKHVQSLSKSSLQSISPIDPLNESMGTFPDLRQFLSHHTQPTSPISPLTIPTSLSPRTQARLKTFKSALLIYFALLGLSPILKSLTKSTSSDSIWNIATCLLIINIFFFDYSSVVRTPPANPAGRRKTSNPPLLSPSLSPPSTITPHPASRNPSALPKAPSNPSITSTLRAPPFPSSLSTNAALMASTVLASRLPSTTAVFSLTVFSIQVFGLFPVFRRRLIHHQALLTVVLIALASAGLGLILSQSYTHTYGACGFCWGWIWHVVWRCGVGVVVGGFGAAFVMGGCSWWLIGLQRYKNVVIGPWDPARPVLAGGVGVYGRGRGGTD